MKNHLLCLTVMTSLWTPNRYTLGEGDVRSGEKDKGGRGNITSKEIWLIICRCSCEVLLR